MLFKIVLILALSSSIQCSTVIDASKQKGIYVSDYCPKMKYCPEGSHVMCMYYNPKSAMGPQCRKAQNISITQELANKLLDVSNAVRSKIARGKEKGKNGEFLPRGYGVFRLRWDSELATFAQVLANQCVLRHDLCRATKKFPEPGQTAGLVRFSVPDWIPASKAKIGTGNFTNPGLNVEKLMYATTQTLKVWYGQKSFVTTPMVTNYPDWINDPNNQNGRLYLEMIYGSSTHMGCGISAYAEYAYYHEHDTPLNYNSVQIICNFSARPRAGKAVYNTVPPTDTESLFNACGCPAGTLEDDDCLCLEIPKDTESSAMHPTVTGKSCTSGDCNPTVVLLPIFTVEDAPPDKLITHKRFPNISVGRGGNSDMERMDIIDSFEELIDHKETLRQSRKTLELPPRSSAKEKQLRSSLHKNRGRITKRRFDMTSEANKHMELNHNDTIHRPMQKSSVFTKTPIFELPGPHNFLKRDVVPRKDFSTGKKLVNKYLYNKNHIILPNERHSFLQQTHENGLNNEKTIRPDLYANKDRHDDVHFLDILTTENNLKTVEKLIINNNKDRNELNSSQYIVKIEDNTVTDKNEKKIMALLDTLEKEVKHLELRDKEKQIFDAKIMKIYGKITGKTSNALLLADKKQHSKKIALQNKEDDEVHKLDPSYDATDDESNLIDEANYCRHEIENDTDDIDLEDFDRPLSKIQKSHGLYERRDKFNDRQFSNNRQNIRNHLSSYEYARQRYLNGRKGYKSSLRNDYGKLRHRSNTMDYKKNKKYYGISFDDPLNFDRQKYYQDKLDRMERKLRDVRQYDNGKDGGRSPHTRALRPSFASDNQMNPLYAGRARILHGY